MAQIVPAILTDDIADAQRQLDTLAGLTEWAQIDFMDGEFVPTVSFGPAEANTLVTEIPLEAHLMVSRPEEWWPRLSEHLFRRVYFHFEAMPNPEEMIKEMREKGFFVGMAVNPETPISAFEDFVEMVDNVMFMTIVPGRQGQPFQPHVLDKIRAFGNQFPDHQIAVDGGINENNIEQVRSAGVDDIGVGSAISRAADPRHALINLQDIIS